MRITLLVFTQTGNTLRVAEVMADALEARNHDVVLLRTALFGPDETDLPDTDLLFVGSPAFYGRPPVVIREYLDALPTLAGVPTVVFATSGGASGRTLWDLRRGLERRGARVRGGAVFPGEVSYPAHSLSGRLKGLPGSEELRRAAAFAAALADSGSAGTATLGSTTRGLWSFYGLVGLALRPRLLRRVLRVPEVDPAVCNRCRWCVGACPVHAIALEPTEERRLRPANGGRGLPAPVIDPEVCIRCYRCLSCPINAYSLDWRAGVEPLIGVLYHRSLVARFGDPEARG